MSSPLPWRCANETVLQIKRSSWFFVLNKSISSEVILGKSHPDLRGIFELALAGLGIDLAYLALELCHEKESLERKLIDYTYCLQN
jgi:hypothetical protein